MMKNNFLMQENTANANPVKKLKIQETRYQCIVCQTNKVSLSELHWHQTYQHSTEELSLSVIGWKGLIKIVGPPTSQEKENSRERSIWNSFSKKPSQFYYLSSSILRVKENQKGSTEAPIDCSLPVLKVEKDIECSNQSKEEVQVDSTVKENSSVYKKLQKELNTIKEISMEDFVKCTNELCSDLAEYKRIPASRKVGRKKHVL
jgi:hypothetical protein